MRFVSLFSGVGGFDLGLEAAGWECVAQVEWDKHCQDVLARHWPDVPRWSDVSEVSGAELPPADVIAFGSPCQDLSIAGKRAGLNGERSVLFFEAVRIIKEMRDATNNAFPRFVIWENVAGALSSSGGRDFGAVLDELADLGAVDIEWAVLDARWFGTPQRRRRVFVVAGFDPRAIGAGQVLHVAPGDPRDPVADDDIVGFYSKHGKFDRPVPGGLPPLTVGTGLGIATSCAVVGARRRARRLTPRESERAQGWPDDHTRWRADGTEVADSHRYRMCGNGVASPVAEWIATQINRAVSE